MIPLVHYPSFLLRTYPNFMEFCDPVVKSIIFMCIFLGGLIVAQTFGAALVYGGDRETIIWMVFGAVLLGFGITFLIFGIMFLPVAIALIWWFVRKVRSQRRIPRVIDYV